MQAIHRHLPTLYLLIALPITLLLSLLTPPFFTPDEQHHAARAIAISHGHLLARIGPEGEAGSPIDTNALRVMDAYDTLRITWEKQSPNFLDRHYGPLAALTQLPLANTRWTTTQTFAPFPNTALYPPILYLPAIAGWRIAERANLTILQSLRLARILCALVAVSLGYLALRLSPSRWLLLPFLLLPTTLFLDASCSQDAALLSIAALLAALLTRPLAARRSFTLPELVTATTLIALCATARPPYLALSLLLFLPAVELRSRRYRPQLAATALIVIAYATWRHLVAPFGFDPPDWANPDRQTAILHAHPLAATTAILHGTATAALDLVQRGLYVLGNNDLLPPHALTLTLLAALALFLAASPQARESTWPTRILLAAAAIGSLLGISYAEYIIWTPPGHPTVWGIQPRYWLPVLPFLLLLLKGFPSPTPANQPTPRRAILLLAALALLLTVDLTLPWIASQAFYRQPVAVALRLNLP